MTPEKEQLYARNRTRILEQRNTREETLLTPQKPATRGYYEILNGQPTAKLVTGDRVYGILNSSGGAGKGDLVNVTRDRLTGRVMLDLCDR